MRLFLSVYEAIKKSAPDCYHDFISQNYSIHCHDTRQSAFRDLFPAKLNTVQYGFKSIQCLGETYEISCLLQ